MAKKIYIGEILGQVNSAIAALQVDMGTMSTNMGNMVTSLLDIGENTSQTISSLNVKVSDVVNATFPTVDGVHITEGTTYGPVGSTISSSASGSVRIKASFRLFASGNKAVSLALFKNGAYIAEVGNHTGNSTWSAVISSTTDVVVAKNDILRFYIKTVTLGSTSKVEFLTGSCSVCYELASLVQDGAFSIV